MDANTSGLDVENDDSLPSADDEWYKERSGKSLISIVASETSRKLDRICSDGAEEWNESAA